MSRNAVLEKKVAPKTAQKKPARLPDALIPTAKAKPSVHRHNGDTPTERPADNFPAPMAEEAFHGLAGRVCSILEAQNETCSEAILGQVLVGFGNLVGKGPRTEEENYLNEFILVIGETATAPQRH